MFLFDIFCYLHEVYVGDSYKHLFPSSPPLFGSECRFLNDLGQRQMNQSSPAGVDVCCSGVSFEQSALLSLKHPVAPHEITESDIHTINK